MVANKWLWRLSETLSDLAFTDCYQLQEKCTCTNISGKLIRNDNSRWTYKKLTLSGKIQNNHTYCLSPSGPESSFLTLCQWCACQSTP